MPEAVIVAATRSPIGRAFKGALKDTRPAQVIPSYRELNIDIGKLNVHGGGIAVGHPFGMTGARITNTLMNGLRERDATIGLETMCVGGGQGMAMIIERLN